MRVIARDMSARRALVNRLQELAESKAAGRQINQLEFERCRIKRNRYDTEIPERFRRLYTFMGRVLAKREIRNAAIVQNRSKTNGNAANA